MTDHTHKKASSKKEAEALNFQRFCDVGNTIPHIVWMAKPGGAVTYYNKRWQEFTGLPIKVKKGQGENKAIHPDDYKKNLPIWRKEKRSGKIVELQYRLRRKDGMYRWFLARLVPIKNPEGKLVQWIGTATDIHEQKRSEIKSEENESRLRLIMNSVKDYAIFMLDVRGKIKSWDVGAEKVFGYKSSDVLGKNFSTLFAPEFRKKYKESELKEVEIHGRAHNEREYSRKDGSVFWGTGILTVIKNKRGRVIGYTKIVRNINERKRAFDALHESEERFRLLVEEIRDYGIIMLDVGGRITTWNKGAEGIFGYRPHEIIGESVHSFYTQQSLSKDEVSREFKKALAHGRVEKEGWRIRKDGALFWANEIMNAIYNREGKLQGFVKIIRDMTEAKKGKEMLKKYTADLEMTQKTLERENAEDEALLESIGEGVIATDEVGRIVLINKPAQTMLGVEAKEVLGMPFYQVWTGYDENHDEIAISDRHVSVVLKTGKKMKSSTHIYSVLHKKKRFPAALTTTPVILEGKTVGTMTVFRDIRKEMEIDRAKSEFVSLASHQLRTPLTAIKLFVEMLASGGLGKLEDEQIEVLKSIEQSNEKMIYLVNSLLNVSHIETGKLNIVYDSVNISDLIKDCVTESKAIAVIKKTQLHFKSNKKNGGEVVTDPNLLRQVLNNLITNAVHYSPSRSKVKITLEKAQGRDYLISVEDYGIGIPKEAQSKVFERFYRAENALKAKTEGTGLGLYMGKIVMESLGGKIWCKSKGEGKGTTFFVLLPGKSEKTKGARRERKPEPLVIQKNT